MTDIHGSPKTPQPKRITNFKKATRELWKWLLNHRDHSGTERLDVCDVVSNERCRMKNLDGAPKNSKGYSLSKSMWYKDEEGTWHQLSLVIGFNQEEIPADIVEKEMERRKAVKKSEMEN